MMKGVHVVRFVRENDSTRIETIEDDAERAQVIYASALQQSQEAARWWADYIRDEADK